MEVQHLPDFSQVNWSKGYTECVVNKPVVLV